MTVGQKSVFICGGHVSPALAIIEELLPDKRLKIYYLGRKYSLEGDSAPSLEYKAVSQAKIPFLELSAGRLSRFLSIRTFSSLAKIPSGFIQSFAYLKKYDPSLVVSFGGYLSLPVSLSAIILGIPVIIHEQTAVLGLSSRLVSLFPSVLCLSFPETSFVPFYKKPLVTGLPLRKSIINPTSSGITHFGNKRLPLIYITGGSQGSVSVNAAVYRIVPALLKKYRLFHVCGFSGVGYDYHRLSALRQSQEEKSRVNYYLTPFLDHNLVGEVLAASSLVIGRSGANTVAEIAIHRKKSILIPLPWSADREQYKNALFLEKSGLGVIIRQDRLKDNLLLSVIGEIISSKKIADTRLISRLFPLDGSEKLAGIIKNKLFPVV